MVGAPSLAQPVTPAQGPALPLPPPLAEAPWRPLSATEPGQTAHLATLASAQPSGHPENDRFDIEIYAPSEAIAPPPTVILLNYWGAVDLSLERSLARRLNERGIAAVIMPLPFHLGRAPEGTRSGEYALRPDVPALRATISQSVSDVRRVIDFIQMRPELNGRSIGLHGTSLGALVGALAFAVEPRIQHGSFLLGGADLASILWSSSRAGGPRDSLRRQGWTEETLREALVDVEPLNYLTPSAARRTMVVKALHDSVVPPENADRLIAALGGPAVLELDTGHYGGFLVQNPLLRQVARFFQASFAGEDYAAPGSFYSPTVRLGLLASDREGVQVAAGLDVWRSDDGRAFAAGVMAPKGLMGFVGLRLNDDFSLGVTVRAKLGWGVFWSTIL